MLFFRGYGNKLGVGMVDSSLEQEHLKRHNEQFSVRFHGDSIASLMRRTEEGACAKKAFYTHT